MGYDAKDENLFSGKNKLTLDRYNKLRSDYDNVIKNFNGINLIIDNPTASGYPYQNEKQTSTTIDKKYRDKKYLSFKNESDFTTKIITTPQTNKTFNINAGFYEIVLIGAGSGGTFYSGTDDFGASSGTSGGVIVIDVYFPTNGTINYSVGEGSDPLPMRSAGRGDYGTLKGGDSSVYFNNNLIGICYGGEGASFERKKKSKIVTWDSYGGAYKLGSYIIKTIISANGPKNKHVYMGRGTDWQICDAPLSDSQYTKYVWNYQSGTQIKYGKGGDARVREEGGEYDPSTSYSLCYKGENGLFLIRQLKSSNYGYLVEGIDVESTYIHTLGNENNIRRKFNTALEKIYNKLSSTTKLTKDSCSILGEKTTESTTAKKYSELKSELEKNYKNVTINPLAFLLEVKTISDGKIFPVDDHIITYDINQKMKLSLEPIKNINKYTPYKNGNDIIYILNTDKNKVNTDINVYKLNDNKEFYKVGIGRFNLTQSKLYESSTGGATTTLTLDKGDYRVICIGAGGGSVAQYRSIQGGGKGAGGGSGSGFDCILKLNQGTYNISIGKGGTSKAVRRGMSYRSDLAGTNGGNTRFGECYSYGGIAGSDGGNTIGTGGGIPNIPYTIVSSTFNKKGNNGKKLSNQYYGTGTGGDAIYKTYGKGGYAQATKDNGNTSTNGNSGYVLVETYGNGKFTYNNLEYDEYDVILDSGPILWSDYEYDLQKLNRLKEYVATKDSWFDSNGYCQRSCQINCQTSVQKS